MGLFETIPGFPREADTQKIIAELVLEFATDPQGLLLMAKQAAQRMRIWGGVAELRGIYCALGFTPADGRKEESVLLPLPKPENLPAYLPAPELERPAAPTAEELAEHAAFVEQMNRKLADHSIKKSMREQRSVEAQDIYREWQRKHTA